jgi:hypothetical protein
MPFCLLFGCGKAKVMKSKIVLGAFCLTLVSFQGHAEWVSVKKQSAFNLKVEYLAAQIQDEFSFGIICTMIDPKSVPRYAIRYKFPREMTPEESADLNNNLHLAIRIDDAEITRTENVMIASSGITATAITNNPPEVYVQLASSKSHIDVALEIKPGEVYAEHRFEDIGDATSFLETMTACKGEN